MKGLPRASLWCAHPRLKPGESLSSWLHRSAFANGMSNHTFCRHLFGERAVWNRDVDHVADEGMLSAAAAGTLESPGRLRQGTIAAFNGSFFEDAAALGGHFPWVLSLGVYHRTRRGHGQQFCVACMAEDPWLRLQWRLAWAVCCTRHGCYLRDACPSCDAPFVFHRISLATPGRLNCHACGSNVLRGHDVLTPPLATLAFQKHLARAAENGYARIGKIERITALDYFAGLRILVRGTFNRKEIVGLLATLPRHVQAKAPGRPAMQIERWRLEPRIFAMDVLRRALMRWPDCFVNGCRRHPIYRVRFRDRNDIVPDWLEDAMRSIARR